MKIYFLRHAHYRLSLKDFQELKNGPLPSAQGLAETGNVAKKLAGKKFAAIYASSADRAKITARVIAERNQYCRKVIIAKTLDPIKIDFFGSDVRRLIGSARLRAKVGILWLDNKLPSFEPLPDFISRTGYFLLALAKRHRQTDEILVVAHWETYAAIQAILRCMPFREASKFSTLKHNTLFECPL